MQCTASLDVRDDMLLVVVVSQQRQGESPLRTRGRASIWTAFARGPRARGRRHESCGRRHRSHDENTTFPSGPRCRPARHDGGSNTSRSAHPESPFGPRSRAAIRGRGCGEARRRIEMSGRRQRMTTSSEPRASRPRLMIVQDPGAPTTARVIGSLAGDAVQIVLDAVDSGVSVLDLAEVSQADDCAVRVLARLGADSCALVACPRWLALWLARV